MKSNVSSRRVQLLPCNLLVALALCTASLAQSTPSMQAGIDHPQLESVSLTRTESFTFVGSVITPDGKPAVESVVVSSAGGQAVTDSMGNYQLKVEVPSSKSSLQITAVASTAGSLLVSRKIDLVRTSGSLQVHNLQLAQAGTCAPSWLPEFDGAPGTDNDIEALAVFDDGGGEALYAGGKFRTAGGVLAQGIAKWDGSEWSGIGAILGTVYALKVFDDGGGEKLYVAGAFPSVNGVSANNIARWDGTNWSALGSGITGVGRVESLCVFDDGGGPKLFVGGDFSAAGGAPASNIAKWDGSSWSTLGTGMTVSGTGRARVSAMTVYDDGGGAALIAGGSFTQAGGIAAPRVASWNGSSWSALGLGINNSSVRALAVFDDGGGAELYVGGFFSLAGGATADNIAKWDGSTWSEPGGGTNNGVRAFAVFDDGGGTALHLVGNFTSAGGVLANSIVKWDGSSWTPLGSGTSGSSRALAVFDDGSGDALIAGGFLLSAGGIDVNNIARWDGSNWAALGIGLNKIVSSLAVFNDGCGPALYVGGDFTTAGGVLVNHIARWDGLNWSALGSGTNGNVGALFSYNDGSGEALYIGGAFNTAGSIPVVGIAKWDGANWSSPGSGVTSGVGGGVRAFAEFDDGGGTALYAAGSFLSMNGVGAKFIAKWDGANWTSLGIGTTGTINALSVFDDGTGDALYAGGHFPMAGGLVANRIAKWDGTSWSSLQDGLNNVVRALTVFDDGGGEALYAGGDFSSAGGVSVRQVAKWNGSIWAPVGSTLGGSVSVWSLTTFNDGNSSALYAGGAFTQIGGINADRIAKWDGVNWSVLEDGVCCNAVYALTTFDDGEGAALYAGGDFFSASDSGNSFIAKWACPSPPSLSGDVASISLSSGGQQILTLEGGPSRAGWFYFMFGSVTGTTPGIDFGCGIILPLNFDVYLNLTLTKPGLGAFGNFVGVLDGAGDEEASLTLPAMLDPGLAGVEINHAYLAASVLGIAEFASMAVPVTLVP